MKKLQTDLMFILLTFLTFFIWYMKDLSVFYGLSIYLLIFLYLFIKRKPVSYYIVVILFSVMSDSNQDTRTFLIDYILTTVLFIGVLIKNIKNKRLVIGNILFLLLSILIYSMISIAWTPIKFDGWQGIVAMLEGYMIYFIATNGTFKVTKLDKIKISKLATYLMFTLTLQILYIYQFHGFETVLRGKNYVELGWGFSNLVAVVYTFFIPVSFYKYLSKEKYYPQYFILDILNLLALILTLSRGAIVGVGTFFIVYIFFTFRKQFILRYYSIIAVIIALVYNISYLNERCTLIIKRFFVERDFLDDSNRFPLYELAFKKFLERPIFGHGLKSSKYMIENFLERSNVYYHDFVLQVAASLGIIGLIMLIILLYKLFRLFFTPTDFFVIALGLGVFTSLVHQLIDISYDRFFFGLYMYTLIAVAELYRHNKKKDVFYLTTIEINKN